MFWFQRLETCVNNRYINCASISYASSESPPFLMYTPTYKIHCYKMHKVSTWKKLHFLQNNSLPGGIQVTDATPRECGSGRWLCGVVFPCAHVLTTPHFYSYWLPVSTVCSDYFEAHLVLEHWLRTPQAGIRSKRKQFSCSERDMKMLINIF
jgi:hypothetical protein